MGRKGNFIKIDRGIVNWRWYKNPNTFRLFVHLLLKANFRNGDFEDTTIERGQVVTSVANLSKDLALTNQEIRTALKHLNSTNEITIRTTNKFSIITVNNYNKYQKIAKRTTNEQQTINKRTTNEQQQYKNVKNDKNVKNERGNALTFGKFKNVFLFQEEYDELARKYPQHYKAKIERLSSYIASSGKHYDNHYAKLLEWLSEDVAKERPSSNASYDIDELENNLDIR